jgi:hypothetical protein
MNRVLSIEWGVIIEKIANFARKLAIRFCDRKGEAMFSENQLTHFIPVTGI